MNNGVYRTQSLTVHNQTEWNIVMLQKVLIFISGLIVLTGCNTVPQPISGEYNNLTVGAARSESQPVKVRWGGVIAKVSNQDDQSTIEIVAKPLNRSARPEDVDATGGRFLAVVPEFIDPVIYKQGREITVVGELSKSIEGKVGEMKYVYPVVVVSGHYLWKERPQYQEVHYYGPSYWPVIPYHYYHYPHWRFKPGVGQPGSRPIPKQNKTKQKQK